MQRRNFLKIAGVSTGAFIFASCSDENAEQSRYLSSPDGYVFHPLKTVNLDEQELQTIMLTNDNRITYHVRDKSTNMDSLYEMNLSFSGIEKPQIIDEKMITQSEKISGYSTNDNGTTLYSATSESNQYLTSVYKHNGGVKTTFLEKGVPLKLDQQDVTLSGNFGDLELDNQDKLLINCGYNSTTLTNPANALIHVDTSTIENINHLFSTSAPIVASSQIVQGMGLIDLSPTQGTYVAQININDDLAKYAGIHNSGAVISGSVSVGGILNHHVLPSSLKNSAAYTAKTISGTEMFGPRTNDLSNIVVVMKNEDELYALYKNNIEVTRETNMTPLKNQIEAFYGYIPAESGLLFYQVHTTLQEDELSIYDGVSSKTILTTKAVIEDREGAPAIVELRFGSVRTCVDSLNRIVLLASFNDNTQAILLGIPA
jgi:hypothetical protein